MSGYHSEQRAKGFVLKILVKQKQVFGAERTILNKINYIFVFLHQHELILGVTISFTVYECFQVYQEIAELFLTIKNFQLIKLLLTVEELHIDIDGVLC